MCMYCIAATLEIALLRLETGQYLALFFMTLLRLLGISPYFYATLNASQLCCSTPTLPRFFTERT